MAGGHSFWPTMDAGELMSVSLDSKRQQTECVHGYGQSRLDSCLLVGPHVDQTYFVVNLLSTYVAFTAQFPLLCGRGYCQSSPAKTC